MKRVGLYKNEVLHSNLILSFNDLLGRMGGLASLFLGLTCAVIIEIVEIILGGPLWKDKRIESGDEIIKVGEPNKEAIDVIGMRIDDAIKLIT